MIVGRGVRPALGVLGVHQRVGARRRARRRGADDRARGDHRVPAAVPRQGARRQRARDRAEVAGHVRRVPRRDEDRARDRSRRARGPAVHLRRDARDPRQGRAVGRRDQGHRSQARARRARSRQAHDRGLGRQPRSSVRSTSRRRRGRADVHADPPIIMGKELAHKLKAKVGDVVTVVVPLSNIDFDTWRAKSSAPRTRKFTRHRHLLQRLRRVRPPPDVHVARTTPRSSSAAATR